MDDGYKTIDGNYSKQAIGYCTYHHGYLTVKQMRTHQCKRKHGGVCSRLQDMNGRYEHMNMQSSLDKMIDRLTKIDTTLNRILKELQKISKSIDTREEGHTLSELDRVSKEALKTGNIHVKFIDPKKDREESI